LGRPWLLLSLLFLQAALEKAMAAIRARREAAFPGDAIDDRQSNLVVSGANCGDSVNLMCSHVGRVNRVGFGNLTLVGTGG
jgi:hypothetical protein